MLIELHRKEAGTDYAVTCCAICGDDFERGSVFCVIFADQGEDIGEMCPTCLDYLNRRKTDEENPEPSFSARAAENPRYQRGLCVVHPLPTRGKKPPAVSVLCVWLVRRLYVPSRRGSPTPPARGPASDRGRNCSGIVPLLLSAGFR